MPIGVAKKTMLLLGALLLAALTAGLLVLVESLAAAQTAGLSLTKEDDPDPVPVGQNLTYTLTVTNEGPNDAAGVTVNDELPGNVEFVSAEASQGGTDACDEQAGVVTCNLGDIGNGDTATVEIVVTPTAVGTLENTAEVSSATDDPGTTNNEATEFTIVDENDDGGDGDDGDDGDGGDDGSDGDEGDDGDNGDSGDNDGGDNDVLEDGVDVTEETTRSRTAPASRMARWWTRPT